MEENYWEAMFNKGQWGNWARTPGLHPYSLQEVSWDFFLWPQRDRDIEGRMSIWDFQAISPNFSMEGKLKLGTSKLWTTGIVGWHWLTGGKRWCMLRLRDSIWAVTRLGSGVLAMLCSTCTESRLRLEMTCLGWWQAANNIFNECKQHQNMQNNRVVTWPGVPHL